jgi:hypothetical protein
MFPGPAAEQTQQDHQQVQLQPTPETHGKKFLVLHHIEV